MPQVKFTSALSRFFPSLETCHIRAETISDVITILEEDHPGLKHYLFDEQNILRKHVNIFVNGHIIKDRDNLELIVDDGSEIYFIQALSGG